MVDFDKLTKLYYSIGEVAEMFDVSKSLIRYWESEFKFLAPKKNKKGDRRFTKENITQLKIIYTLVKERGFTLDGARLEIRNNRKSLLARQEIVSKLQSLKQKAEALRNRLED